VRRVAAVLAAAAMVVAAFALRESRQDDGDAAPADVPTLVVCADDLADACAAAGLDHRAERAGDTADRLVATEVTDALDGQAWLVTSAWAALVLDERARLGRDPRFEVSGEPLATSDVALVTWADRRAQLASRCGLGDDDVGWRCVAEQSGEALAGGDRVRAALPDVATATGLVVAASQAAGLLGRTDFASNDFDERDFRTLAGRLAAGQTADPLRRMRAEGPGQITTAGVLAAQAANLTSSFGTLHLDLPAPAVRADVVLVVEAGGAFDGDQRAAIVDALRAAGWDPARDDGDDGLPAGGVLAAIRTLWADR
jgi:hypothetical protein